MQAASRSSSICQQQQARQHISSVVSRSPQFAHCEQTVWSTATPSATRVHQHLLLTAGEHKHAAGALHQPVFLAVAQPHRKSRRRVSHRADHPRHRLSGRAAPRGAAAVAGLLGVYSSVPPGLSGALHFTQRLARSCELCCLATLALS